MFLLWILYLNLFDIFIFNSGYDEFDNKINECRIFLWLNQDLSFFKIKIIRMLKYDTIQKCLLLAF
jgi:hypothetical protein